MIKFLRNLWRDRRGNALVIAAGALPLLIGSAGFATDTIQWALWKRELQRAADSAAIAGVYDRVANGGATSGTLAAVTHDLGLNNHTLVSLMSGYPQVTFPEDAPNQIDQVRVALQVQRRLPFSSLFLSTPPIIVANATAASVPGPGDPCVLSLQKGAKEPGIKITGNAGILMPGCILHTNASGNDSSIAKGSSKVKAKTASSVGGIEQSSSWEIESYAPYSPEIKDPYEKVNPYSDPSEMKCAGHWETKGSKSEWVYDALTSSTDVGGAKDINNDPANCWTSLNVSPSEVLNLPGNRSYYINGGDVDVQGDMSCTKCTIVLTNKDTSNTATIGDLKVNADAKINLTAPDSGNFKGIAIYQDRRATDKGSSQSKINGNSDSVVQGALYFPSTELDYNGTGNTSAVCTRFVAKRVVFSGNSGISNQINDASLCAAFGLTPGNAARRVRLVG